MTKFSNVLTKHSQREKIEYDIVIVGAGPAGLSSAIRLKQLAIKENKKISICVLEKSKEVGSHILSGAIIDPKAIIELFPNWKELGAPLITSVTEDRFFFLNSNKAYKIPTWMLPNCFKNHGNYIISLANLVRWLGKQAEMLGVDIFSGFAAAEILYDKSGAVQGVATGNTGIDRHGQPTHSFQPGIALHAKYTFFAEGARGHLGKQLITKYTLDKDKDPQTYSIGIKEMWEIDPKLHQPGLVIHTAGWPLDKKTYGGSFLYHMENNQVSVGFVISLSYENPYLSPYEEFQRYKTHPTISKFFKNGKRLAYGARAITSGGLQALPKLTFPGGILIGCDAGFLNTARTKGSHTAIKSGMLAAEATFLALNNNRQCDEINDYSIKFQQSWLYDELYKARNFKPLISKGLYKGILLIIVDQILLGGKAPWTIHQINPDYACLKPAANFTPIKYPKPDGKLTFDKLSSVFISNTNHIENQPIHLTLKDQNTPITINLTKYAGLEMYYCPAGVYEFLKHKENIDYLQINAQNCIHCKTCDIKDPTQNIIWVPPEGGDGPNYTNM